MMQFVANSFWESRPHRILRKFWLRDNEMPTSSSNLTFQFIWRWNQQQILQPNLSLGISLEESAKSVIYRSQNHQKTLPEPLWSPLIYILIHSKLIMALSVSWSRIPTSNSVLTTMEWKILCPQNTLPSFSCINLGHGHPLDELRVTY